MFPYLDFVFFIPLTHQSIFFLPTIITGLESLLWFLTLPAQPRKYTQNLEGKPSRSVLVFKAPPSGSFSLVLPFQLQTMYMRYRKWPMKNSMYVPSSKEFSVKTSNYFSANTQYMW